MCPHCVGGVLIGLWLAWHEWRYHLAWRFPRLDGWHRRLWCRLFGHHKVAIQRVPGGPHCRRCDRPVQSFDGRHTWVTRA